jgi:putative uncharacterized protein FNV1996
MDNISALKKEERLEIQYEIINIETSPNNELKKYIRNEIENITKKISDNNLKLQDYNEQIKKFTNQADALDYTVAISSGILAGIVDSFFVGNFSFKDGKAWSNHKVNDFVMNIAKKKGYNGQKKNGVVKFKLNGAINFLEDEFKIPSDNIWSGKNININSKSHHLDDLAHHPTLVGLIASIITQFTEKAYFQNRFGKNFGLDITEKGLIGNTVYEKILAGTTNWFYHLVSDMSGSNKTAGVGMGIPGPLLSLAKEFSMLPGINKTNLPKLLDKAFREYKFDLRSELAVFHQLGKQTIPVILNEVLVRVFYFFSRLIKEYKEKENFKDIEWKNVLPYKNRTLTRMLTISSGTFLAFDLLDAGVRSGGNWGAFVLRVNFVNVGRFTISCYNEYKMEREKEKIEKDILDLYNQQLSLNNIELSYNIVGMWISTKEAVEKIEELSNNIQSSIPYIEDSNRKSKENLNKIGDSIDIIKKEKKNEKLLKKIKNILSE